MNQLQEAIVKEIVDTRVFKLVGGIMVRNISLLPDGKVSDYLFRCWALDYNSILRCNQLKLFSSALNITLVLTREGKWSGKSSGQPGIVELIPSGGQWGNLYDPGRFYRSLVLVDFDGTEFKYDDVLQNQIDWEPYRQDFPKEQNNGTAIAIVGCDRPDYFERTVKSIALNECIGKYPLYVFLDQPENGDKAVTDAQIDVVDRTGKFDYVKITVRERNFGCGRNLIDVRRQLFDNMGFERVFIFEDDMVVSRNYIQFTVNLLDWAERNFSNIGAVQGWSQCIKSKIGKFTCRWLVEAVWNNWWGYLMTKRAWDAIKVPMYWYEKHFLGAEYVHRPHRSILKWFKKHVPSICFGEGNYYPVNKKWGDAGENYLKAPPTGQDAATMHLLHRAGMVRLAPVVNRGLYIGRTGIHMTPYKWKIDGFDNVHLDEFEDDSKIIEFIPEN